MLAESPNPHRPFKQRHLTQRLRTFLAPLLALCLALSAFFAEAGRSPEALQQQLIERFNPSRLPLLNEWLALVNSARKKKDEDKLTLVNDFINRHIVFENDMSIWQQSDYWATPLETIGQGQGDCEDFAIIKYVSLLMAGVAENKLRLIYVKAQINAPDGATRVAHMTLAYYAAPNADPLLLDNLQRAILPASKRTDLQPVFSFNRAQFFAGISGHKNTNSGSSSRLSRWEDALRRILAEGYE